MARSPSLMLVIRHLETDYAITRAFRAAQTTEELTIKLVELKLKGASFTPEQQKRIEHQLTSLKLSPDNRAVEKP